MNYNKYFLPIRIFLFYYIITFLYIQMAEKIMNYLDHAKEVTKKLMNIF